MITITSRTETGMPATAETAAYTWFWGSPGYLHEIATGRAIYGMARMYKDRMGSEPITDESERQAITAFWSELRAEESRCKAQWDAACAARAEADERARIFPCDERLAKRYDDVYNEGGEGYNPYR